MKTLEFYTVYNWIEREGAEAVGHYQSKQHAEYIRDHVEALAIKSYVEQFPVGKRDEASKSVHWLDQVQGFGISEEELFLVDLEVCK